MSLVACIDLETERAILGAALLDARAVGPVATMAPEWCHAAVHQHMVRAIQGLAQRGEPVDHEAVRAALIAMGEPPARLPVVLAACLEAAALPTSLPRAISLLQELAGRRALLAMAARWPTTAADRSIPWSDVLEAAARDVAALDRRAADQYLTPEAWADELRVGRDLPRLTTGLPVWDADGGLTYGDVHVLAARPGLGKTMVALQVAVHVAVTLGLPVLFISAEMSRIQLGRRLQRLIPIDTLATSGLYIADPAGPSVAELATLIRHTAAEQAIALLILDHLQEVRPATLYRDRRDLEIREIMQTMRDLVKRLNLSCLCVSQLNREVEHRRTSPKPQLSDLRDGGAIEEQAASVTFLYQPGEDPEQEPLPVAFAMRKNRHGRVRDWAASLSRAAGRVS
jgi:replicative DNA helicase